jgi:hypothetical protein
VRAALALLLIAAGCVVEPECPPDSPVDLGELLESDCPDPGKLRASQCVGVPPSRDGEGCELRWFMFCAGGHATASWDTETREGFVTIRYPGVCSEVYKVDSQ